MATEAKQTMMIIWRWKDLLHLNEKYWDKTAADQLSFAQLSQDIELGRGHFYDEVSVEESDICENTKILRAGIYKTSHHGKDAIYHYNDLLLDTLLDKFAPSVEEAITSTNERHEFLLLLHRGNSYKQADVARILQKFKGRITNVFLFASGRDPIYYGTQRLGLLNDTGGFYQGVDPKKKEIIVIRDPKTGKVRQPFFDRTWMQYKTQFELKVFELKEDLFRCFFPFLLPQQPESINAKQLVESISGYKDSLLLYRLKSFLGSYEAEADKKLLKKFTAEKIIIRQYEEDDQCSYLFDDCIANLKNQELSGETFVSDQYNTVQKMLTALFFQNKPELSKHQLRELLNELNYLVKIIPGYME